MQQIETFYDARTYTLTFVVWDDASRDAVIIDPVLDYDPASSRIWTESAEEVVAFIRGKELNPVLILETHAHADHLSGAAWLKKAFPGVPTAIGRRITEVQSLFKGVFDLPEDFATDGSQFEMLLDDGQTVEIGSLSFKVIFTPGHTPACASYLFEDALFTGDALFMPDMGTGRCDFPGGSARDMYHSIHEKLYSLPDDTQVYVGHDYQPGGREVAWLAPLSEHKSANVMLKADTTEKEFVERREARDATLAAPKLLFQSVQVNVDAGRLPEPEPNKIRYLKLPINVFRPEEGGDLSLDAV